MENENLDKAIKLINVQDNMNDEEKLHMIAEIKQLKHINIWRYLDHEYGIRHD